MEFDFIVALGADPRVIAFTLEGADTVEIDAQGNLGVSLQGREVVFRTPFVYQEKNGRRREIAGRYVRRATLDSLSDSGSHALDHPSHPFGFELAAYDPARPLVIDPVISFSTYLGGSGRDLPAACAVDAFGNVYVVSYTELEMPLSHPLNPFREAVHIAKFDPTGSLVFGTYFGGSGIGRGERLGNMAVDAAGNIYLVGHTSGHGPFPSVNPLFPLYAPSRGADAFVTKIDAAGSRIISSSVLSGSREDYANGVAADAAGNAYVVGHTLSADFPTTTNAFQPQFGGNGDEGDSNNLQGDAFLLKINPDGSRLLFSSFLGGSLADQARAVALDDAGHAFVTGFTESTDFPLANAFQTEMHGADSVLYKRGDAFVTKVNSAGTALLFSTYLGGTGPDYGIDMATDRAGDVYVSGYTCCATDFPFKNGFERPDFGARGFVTKLRGDGSQLVYSTALWATFDYETHIAVDALGAVYAVGDSTHDIRVANPIQDGSGARLAGHFDLDRRGATVRDRGQRTYSHGASRGLERNHPGSSSNRTDGSATGLHEWRPRRGHVRSDVQQRGHERRHGGCRWLGHWCRARRDDDHNCCP
ncbi:MAG: SBBP repeat-containing protein [Chloroflexi bacterium]|nr:SBBP repeat-containing protein [Chloroflexota bacterium]